MTRLLWILLCLSAGLTAAITDGSGVNSSIPVVGGLKVPDNLLSKILGNISKFPFTSTHTADRFEVFLMSFFGILLAGTGPCLLAGLGLRLLGSVLACMVVPDVTTQGVVSLELLPTELADVWKVLVELLELLVELPTSSLLNFLWGLLE